MSEERRIVGDQQAQVDAFAVAQSGLERYVALRDSEPAAFDSVAIPIGVDDTAYVALFRIRAPSGTIKGQYVIRSRGISHGGRFSFNTPAAQRTVAQYATWQDASMDVDAAWTSIGGLAKDGHHRHHQRVRWVRHPGAAGSWCHGADVRRPVRRISPDTTAGHAGGAAGICAVGQHVKRGLPCGRGRCLDRLGWHRQRHRPRARTMP